MNNFNLGYSSILHSPFSILLLVILLDVVLLFLPKVTVQFLLGNQPNCLGNLGDSRILVEAPEEEDHNGEEHKHVGVANKAEGRVHSILGIHRAVDSTTLLLLRSFSFALGQGEGIEEGENEEKELEMEERGGSHVFHHEVFCCWHILKFER